MAERRNSVFLLLPFLSSSAGHCVPGGHTPSSPASLDSPPDRELPSLLSWGVKRSLGHQRFLSTLPNAPQLPAPCRETDLRGDFTELTNVGRFLSLSAGARERCPSAWVSAVRVGGVKCHSQVFLPQRETGRKALLLPFFHSLPEFRDQVRLQPVESSGESDQPPRLITPVLALQIRRRPLDVALVPAKPVPAPPAVAQAPGPLIRAAAV